MKTGSNSAFIVTFHETNLLLPQVDIFRGVMSLEIDFVKVSIGKVSFGEVWKNDS